MFLIQNEVIMKYKFLLFLSFSLLFFSCGSNKDLAATKAQKERLQNMISNSSFVINSDWANPRATTSFIQVANSGLLPPGSNASNINLIGNDNYLKFHKDSVMIELPFYGERQMGGGYNNSSGFSYAGLYDDYKMNYSSKKGFYTIKFNVKIKTESLNISIRLYDNLKSSMIINSSHRTSISYEGNVSELDMNNK